MVPSFLRFLQGYAVFENGDLPVAVAFVLGLLPICGAQNQIEQIVRLQIGGIQRLLKEQEVTLRVTDAAVKLVAQAGFDPEFGARPVKRALQRLLLNDLSKALLAGTVNKEKPIEVDANGSELRFSNAE